MGCFTGFLLSFMLAYSSLSALMPTSRTYFLYSPEEIISLRRYEPRQSLTIEQIAKWDPLVQGENLRMRTYLYAAQQEAAALSASLGEEGQGSLDPISLQVLRLFNPDLKEEAVADYHTDLFSDELARIVVGKFQERLKLEEKRIRPYVLRVGPEFWNPKGPPLGITFGYWLPWTLCSSSEFRAHIPPAYQSPEWKQQKEAVASAVARATPEQKSLTEYWEGPNKHWLNYAISILGEKNASVEQFLQLRSDLAMVLYDGTIAAFDSKYTYAYPRPNQGDPEFQYLIDMPNHPSYPSGHSALAAAAAEVLSFYYPEEAQTWEARAAQAGHSRIWGGLHYPMDHTVGFTMGKNVGKCALDALHRRLWIEN